MAPEPMKPTLGAGYVVDRLSEQYNPDIVGLLAENERLRAALTQACRDGWSDPQAAMEHYLTTADDWLVEAALTGSSEAPDD